MNEKDLKYRILWLDDDFEPVETAVDQDEINRRQSFQDDVEYAAEYGIEVVPACNYESFSQKLQEIESYHAVVFDLKGMEMNSEVTDKVITRAYDLVKGTLPCFVYSANSNSEKFELSIDEIVEKDRAFNKALGVQKLYSKIIEVLDANLHYYERHKECLQVFNKGFLSVSFNKSKMDELLRKYEEKDVSYSPYNNMRQILEDMFSQLVTVGLIDSSRTRFNERLKYLAKEYELTDGKPDFNRPKVTHSVCPLEVKNIFYYLCDMTNSYSHFDKTYNSQHEFKQLIQESVYSSFFVAVKWFYSYMTSLAKNANT